MYLTMGPTLENLMNLKEKLYGFWNLEDLLDNSVQTTYHYHPLENPSAVKPTTSSVHTPNIQRF